MKIYLAFVTIFALSLTAQSAQFISIGTCSEDGEKLRVLMAKDESLGLLVFQTPDPDDPSASYMTAENVSLKKFADDKFQVILSPDSDLGKSAQSFNFLVTKEGTDWKSKYRKYNCKLD